MKNNVKLHTLHSTIKKIVLCFILLFCLDFANAIVPTAQQQLYITFGGGIIQDLSPNGFPIGIFGAPTLTGDRFAPTGCAMSFAPGDKLTIPFNPVFNMTPGHQQYSISLWYNGFSPALNDLEFLFNKTNPSALLTVQSDYNVCILSGNRPHQGTDEVPVRDQLIQPGAGWHHLLAMYHAGGPTGGLWTLYIDNIASYVNVPAIAIGGSTGQIEIGGNYSGSIDDIVFYDRLLSALERTQLFNDNNSCASTACGCPVPSGLSIGSCATPGTSILSWTGNACASSYQVLVQDQTIPLSPWIQYPVITNTVSISTTTANAYIFKVRSRCPSGAGFTTSAWSSISSFTGCRLEVEDLFDEPTTSFQIYPNPATNHLTIKSITKNVTITIFDLTGKIVIANYIADYEMDLGIAELENGIYFIKMESDEHSETKKIVKNQ